LVPPFWQQVVAQRQVPVLQGQLADLELPLLPALQASHPVPVLRLVRA